MKLLFSKTPKFVTWLYPKRIWAFSRSENKVYLSFDDGPIPEVTPWVLDQLNAYNAKATFFCIGENIKKHPEIFVGGFFQNLIYFVKNIMTRVDSETFIFDV